jgi:poly(3-hydroxybutyrate) depolymerase
MIRCFLLLALSVVGLRAEEVVFRDGLAVKIAHQPHFSSFRIDAVEEAMARGEWAPPSAGETLPTGGTNHTWQAVTAPSDGVFTNGELEGGYFYRKVVAPEERVAVLSAAGQDMAFVNGEPRPGDPYFNGILQLPVLLRRGTNDFLFRVSRGRFAAKLTEPPKPVWFSAKDATLPDIVQGENEAQWASAVIVNCTTNYLRDLKLRAEVDGHGAMNSELGSIPPLSVRKETFRFKPRWSDRTNRLELSLKLTQGGQTLDTASLWLGLRRADEEHSETYLSEVDGSAQYYAVTPAQPLPGESARALFLSLHGAGVEASGQASSYQAKTWGTVVAPTNRRYYGFDWEDWGERDAMDVLNLATKKFQIDPHEVYLTGHSMGGHGTWHVGATYPDRFAAIAPSAGWISFASYANREDTTNAAKSGAMEELLERAANAGDTLGLASNYLHLGVYILHGDNDETVPVSEARTMRDRLSEFHKDFLYHEQAGAGHWWGSQCVDWPPLFDFFARHRLPSDNEVCDINFTTMNPGVSASSHWISIEAQQHALEKSTVRAHYDPARKGFEIVTDNVAKMVVRLTTIARALEANVTLDGQVFEHARGETLWFQRDGNRWMTSVDPSATNKGPRRYGPLKAAIGHRMEFVYGTKGTPEENAWAAAKARFDAETWWYRGNGSVDVVPDEEFDAKREPNRGILLYGNADNNAAWAALLADSPVQVRRGAVEIGTRVLRGDDLACLFCRPRPGSDEACVVAISSTGVAGARAINGASYLTAGTAYPDCTVFGAETLSKGTEGVRAAGFFGMDWGVASGDFVWRE